jgi:hypothetical protein
MNDPTQDSGFTGLHSNADMQRSFEQNTAEREAAWNDEAARNDRPLNRKMDRAHQQQQQAAYVSYLQVNLKALAAYSKKALAKEVVRLAAQLKRQESLTPHLVFEHGYKLLRYALDCHDDDTVVDTIIIWNARDGAAPEVVNIGAKRYLHQPQAATGPHFTLHAAAHYRFEDRTEAKTLKAWHATLDKMIELSCIDPDKMVCRDDLEAARSWGYHVGLRNLATDRFTSDEVLASTSQTSTESTT